MLLQFYTADFHTSCHEIPIFYHIN